MLKQSVGTCPQLADIPKFQELINDVSLLIITQLSINTVENNQLFLTFDDFIHYYYLGKGIGQLSISGMIFTTCAQQMVGLTDFYVALTALRGQPVDIHVAAVRFTGLLTDCTVTINSEPETIASFTANFAMIDHDLMSYAASLPTC